jgi:hypothetical protein
MSQVYTSAVLTNLSLPCPPDGVDPDWGEIPIASGCDAALVAAATSNACMQQNHCAEPQHLVARAAHHQMITSVLQPLSLS